VKVAVLGCGPAGLFAAHAAVESGHDVRIFSVKRKSHMFGAQYLHCWIHGLTQPQPEYRILYLLNGKEEEYARKVYGDTPPDFVSPAQLEGEHPGWDIRRAYDRAWARYSDLIEPIEKLTARRLWGMVFDKATLGWASRVISTVPAPDVCMYPDQHTFSSRQVWAIGDAPERGVACPVEVLPESVVCDGTPDVGWYRASNIGGYRTAEWPGDRRPPYEDIAEVTKVVRTNCDCWRAEGFWRTGRYGAWDKKLLTHHAYWSILDAFRSER
jgi:hypothetical protein